MQGGVPVYLANVAPESARRLAEVNAAGIAALHTYLASGEAVAFLGAGASAPLYLLWQAVIAELIDAGVARGLGSEAAVTCRELAGDQPDAVVELLRRHLGAAQYQAALRQAFRVRRDSESGRSWTPVQELVCRCSFKAVVTTNYDPGIVDPPGCGCGRGPSGTGFSSWTGRRLAWHELDALEAQAYLDTAEGADHGWAAKAADLRKRLIPDGLDPDPLTTVERRVANEKLKNQA